jgi:hypothetical protein
MEMAKLHDKAKQANITILCEMGLDPGIGITFTFLPSFVLVLEPKWISLVMAS